MSDAGRLLTADERKAFAWLRLPHVKNVADALQAARPDAARFVGGCVRDSLMGATPKDFDIATPLTPDAVVAALKAAGLKSAPTGIEHGTITAIADHKGVEVTTLRADVSTDGRRATVAFTEDWAVDAGRRDFTINALYLTPDGRLYDPINGFPDIAKKCVRFIGDAELRIKEDYLRILRFFRFSARFASGFDETGLAACAAKRDGISQLSAERIGMEFMSILALPRADFALSAMRETGVLGKIWDAPANIEALRKMKSVAPHASAPVLIAALYGENGAGIRAGLRLSNAEGALRTNALRAETALKPALSGRELRALAYRFGRDAILDGAALAFAWDKISADAFGQYRQTIEGWTPPTLPFSGKDFIARGVAPGPDVAKMQATAEQQWIDEDFPGLDRVSSILDEIAAQDENKN